MTVSTTYNNQAIPLYEDGERLTGWATAAVGGKKFVTISGNRQAGGEISIAPPANKGRAIGVAEYDAGINKRTGILRPSAGIIPVIATGAAIAAMQEVMSDATGGAVPFDDAAGSWALGYAITGSAGGGADVFLVLYGTPRLSHT